MGQGVDQAQRQRELTKHALELDLDRLEARVRSELDWRTRLRREGPRLVAMGAAVVVLAGGVLILRRRLNRGRAGRPEQSITLEDLTSELREIRRTLEKQNGKSSSFVQKALLRGVSAAGTAGGTLLARRMLQRQMTSPEEGPGTASAG